MEIRPVTDADLERYVHGRRLTFGARSGMEHEVAPAEAIVFGDEIHVPWQPSEIDVAALAHGGTVWLVVVGGLPPHRLEVRPRG